MSVGDVTHDKHPIQNSGSVNVVTGVIEADTTARAFQLVNAQQALVSCTLECQTDDATTDTRSTLNTTANFSTSSSGSLAVQAEAADTFRFRAEYK